MDLTLFVSIVKITMRIETTLILRNYLITKVSALLTNQHKKLFPLCNIKDLLSHCLHQRFVNFCG